MLKRILQIFLLLVVLVVVIPFVGPWIGLSDYRANAPSPGQQVDLSDGDHLNVYREGIERPVVLIHGRPGNGSTLRPLALALKQRGFTPITYDRVGYGHSSRRSHDTPANPTENARELLQLIGALQLDDPYVIGYSYGGGVALEAGRLDPHAFSRLALISSIGDNSVRVDPPQGTDRLLFSVPVMRWMLGTEFISMRFARPGNAAMFYPNQSDDAFLRQVLAGLSLPGVPDTYVREVTERYQGFDGYQPEAITACTLIIQGVEDMMVPAKGATILDDAIQNSELRMLEDTGHAAVIEQPDRLAELLAEHDEKCLQNMKRQ
jgi:pimeloyl-ACP methyl ester carboxylesterase